MLRYCEAENQSVPRLIVIAVVAVSAAQCSKFHAVNGTRQHWSFLRRHRLTHEVAHRLLDIELSGLMSGLSRSISAVLMGFTALFMVIALSVKVESRTGQSGVILSIASQRSVRDSCLGFLDFSPTKAIRQSYR